MPRKQPKASEIVDGIAAIQDPAQRGEAATNALTELADAQEAVKKLRQHAVDELLEAGWTYKEIGEALGVTRGRAYQIGQGMSGSTAKD